MRALKSAESMRNGRKTANVQHYDKAYTYSHVAIANTAPTHWRRAKIRDNSTAVIENY